MLATYNKDNAAAIFEVFRQNRPKLNINAYDADDNTGIDITIIISITVIDIIMIFVIAITIIPFNLALHFFRDSFYR